MYILQGDLKYLIIMCF